MKYLPLIALVLAVTVSGCSSTVEPVDNEKSDLMGKVSDKRVTDESPGEITLNARNRGNQTASFHVKLSPVGDYSDLARVTDREGSEITRVNLGEAVPGATTGEKFAEVRKDLNVTANVKIKAELFNETADRSIETQTYTLKMVEE